MTCKILSDPLDLYLTHSLLYIINFSLRSTFSLFLYLFFN